MITQHLKLVFALYHSSSSSSLQVYPAPKKLCPDSLLSGEKGTPASLLIPSSSSHCLHCRQCAWIWSDCMSRTSKFWSALCVCVCVSGHRLYMSVSCSTTWLRRMRTTRTLFAGATVAEAGARSAWVYISQHAFWHFNISVSFKVRCKIFLLVKLSIKKQKGNARFRFLRCVNRKYNLRYFMHCKPVSYCVMLHNQTLLCFCLKSCHLAWCHKPFCKTNCRLLWECWN